MVTPTLVLQQEPLQSPMVSAHAGDLAQIGIQSSSPQKHRNIDAHYQCAPEPAHPDQSRSVRCFCLYNQLVECTLRK